MRISLSWQGLALGLGFVAAGCPGNGSMSETSSETDSEACQPGTLNCVCEANGCDPGLICASGYCVENTSGTSGNTPTGPDNPTTTTEPTTSSGPTTDTPGCSGDDACSDAAKPFCVEQLCVSCDDTPDPDAACAQLSADAPVCDSGQCIACTADNPGACGGTTPICDAATNECVACVEHDDCPESACDIYSGACLAPERVLYVHSQAQCGIGEGTVTAPFCQISHAIDKMVIGGPELGWTIKVKAGDFLHPALVVPEGSVLAILGDGGVPKIRSTTPNATLQIGASSKIILNKLNFASNTENAGLSCAGSQIRGADLTFSQNRYGYHGTDCSAWFERSVFYRNTSGALSLFGPGTTGLVNTYVSNNGSNAESDYGGLLTGQGHQLKLLYSTVLNNLSEFGARSLQCMPDAGETLIRNSVIVAFVPPSIDCPGVTIEHSAVDDGKVDGDTNVAAVMGDVGAWFEPPVNGVYKAKADTPLANLAVWKDGDPAADFNGDERPGVDGGTDYAGADRP